MDYQQVCRMTRRFPTFLLYFTSHLFFLCIEIMLLAQNELPFSFCYVCGDEATCYCPECVEHSDNNPAEGFYCDVCATDDAHDCVDFELEDDNHRIDLEQVRDYINSPRFG